MKPTFKSNLTTSIDQFVADAINDIKKRSNGKPVLCALSGGVDSAVCAVMAQKAVGDKLTCIFVDTGFMRKGEGDFVEKLFKETHSINLIRVNAEARYLKKLKGVTEPEKKRKIIGEEFIRIFEEEAKKLGEVGYFMQGTIYPDVSESGHDGHKNVKSHHNVGGLPDIIDFKGILEPLRSLYKEEVRACAVALGLPKEFAFRQPFPGPGLAVRVLGELTKEKCDIVREADAIFTSELEAAGLSEQAKQYFAMLPNVSSVGVRNSARVYEQAIVLRAVHTTDFVSASVVPLPYEFLAKVVNRITTEVKGVNRVVYDLTPKPSGTIEWE